MEETSLRPPSRIVVVSHLLPITLSKDADTGAWAACWDQEIARPETAISRYLALGVRGLDTPCLFVGSPSIFVPVEDRPAVEAAIEAAGIAAAVVYVEKSVASRFYQGYCKSTLWPILHNVIDVYNSKQVTNAIVDQADADRPPQGGGTSPPARHAASASAQPEAWQAPRSWNPTEAAELCWQDYCRVNRAVAQTVVEHYQEGDLVWVQHYHLMLLPSELARKLRGAAHIGAHSPRAAARWQRAMPAAAARNRAPSIRRCERACASTTLARSRPRRRRTCALHHARLRGRPPSVAHIA